MEPHFLLCSCQASISGSQHHSLDPPCLSPHAPQMGRCVERTAAHVSPYWPTVVTPRGPNPSVMPVRQCSGGRRWEVHRGAGEGARLFLRWPSLSSPTARCSSLCLQDHRVSILKRELNGLHLWLKGVHELYIGTAPILMCLRGMPPLCHVPSTVTGSSLRMLCRVALPPPPNRRPIYFAEQRRDYQSR